MAAKKRERKKRSKSTVAVGSNVAPVATQDETEAAASATPNETGNRVPIRSTKETASEFIRRQLGQGKSPAEVVLAAEAAGLTFSRALIYAVKSRTGRTSRQRAKEGIPRGARPRGPRPRAPNNSTVADATDESRFRRAALDLGIDRAKQLLEDLSRAIEALLSERRGTHRLWHRR